MYAAVLALIFLIDVTPAMLIINDEYGTLISGLVSVVTAFALVVIAWTFRHQEGDHLWALVRPIAILAVLPAIWMVVQSLPLPSLSWAHPVWQSAAAALGEPLFGSLSIDRGATLVALCNYLLTVAIIFIAIAVGIDRQRAESILITLIGVTTLIAVLIVIQDLVGIKILGEVNGTTVHDAAINSVALGAILSAAMAGHAFDPQKKWQAKGGVLGSVGDALTSVLAAFTVCMLTLIFFGTVHALIATSFGLAILISIVTMRHFGFGRWGAAGIAAILAVALIAMIATQPRIPEYDLTLAFASSAVPQGVLSTTQRILNDWGSVGSGAGTYRALVPIYKDIDDVVDRVSAAPTAAAVMVVEFGRLAFWLATIAAIAAILLLSRGAILRGRDQFFPAAGAGCIMTAMLLAFSNVAMFSSATSIVIATIVGLALAQSKSRTNRQM